MLWMVRRVRRRKKKEARRRWFFFLMFFPRVFCADFFNEWWVPRQLVFLELLFFFLDKFQILELHSFILSSELLMNTMSILLDSDELSGQFVFSMYTCTLCSTEYVLVQRK